MNSLLVNDEETNGSGGEMEEAVEEEIEVINTLMVVDSVFLLQLIIFFDAVKKK